VDLLQTTYYKTPCHDLRIVTPVHWSPNTLQSHLTATSPCKRGPAANNSQKHNSPLNKGAALNAAEATIPAAPVADAVAADGSNCCNQTEPVVPAGVVCWNFIRDQIPAYNQHAEKNLLKQGGLSGAAGQRSLVLSVWRGLRLGEVIEGRLWASGVAFVWSQCPGSCSSSSVSVPCAPGPPAKAGRRQWICPTSAKQAH